MKNSIKCTLNTFVGFIIFWYIIYISDSRKRSDNKYLDIIFSNKVYRLIFVLVITFTAVGMEVGSPAIGGNFTLALLVMIGYTLSMSYTHEGFEQAKCGPYPSLNTPFNPLAHEPDNSLLGSQEDNIPSKGINFHSDPSGPYTTNQTSYMMDMA